MVSRDNKVHKFTSSLFSFSFFFSFFFFFFFVGYYYIWSSGRDYVIRLYLKIPKVFVHLNFQDGFWVVLLPFVHKVNFQFLAQFPIDHPLTQSRLFLYSFCFNLLLSLIMWLIVSIVSRGYNHTSSAFFYVIFELFYRCINAIFNAGKSSSSFFS